MYSLYVPQFSINSALALRAFTSPPSMSRMTWLVHTRSSYLACCLWPIAQQSHRKVDKLGKCGSDKSVAVFLKASQVKRQKIVLYHFDKTAEHFLFSILSFGTQPL